jgi:site-specific DNA recombinase
MGKLYDDRGNRMSPSYSAKNGIRYRFYVSSALLRGRKADAGTVGRVAAAEIERTVRAALKPQQQQGQSDSAPASIEEVERVVIAPDHLLITTTGAADDDGTNREFRIPWSTTPKNAPAATEDNGVPEVAPNESLIKSIVRAHAWMDCLRGGTYVSIEHLAGDNRLHPKVVRQALRMAFLSPEVTSAMLEGRQSAGLTLARVPKLLSLSWVEHGRLLV